jgi:hypothetical protein
MTSYYVAVLDLPLPVSIAPAWLLPANWRDYMPRYTLLPIPAIATNKHKEALTNCGLRFGRKNLDGTPYAAWSKQIIGGDSSSPVYTQVRDAGGVDRTILLTSWYYGGWGDGPPYSDYIAVNNTRIAALQTINGITFREGDPTRTRRAFSICHIFLCGRHRWSRRGD